MSFTWRAPRLLSTLLTAVLLSGTACVHWNLVDESSYCVDTKDCLEMLQTVSGVVPDVATRHLPPLQEIAARSLARGGPEVIAPLVALLEHPDSRVRGGAASALASVDSIPSSAVPAILRAAEREPGGFAMIALAHTDDVRALPLLREHFTQLPDLALGLLGPHLFPLLLEVLEDSGSSQQAMMRVSAGVAEGAPDVEWLPRLRALLRRELDEPRLRLPAGAVCPTPPLQGCSLMFDDCTPRAAHVVWALENLWIHSREKATPRELSEVREALRRGDARLTPRALEALIVMGALEEVDPLLKELAIPGCRREALGGLRDQDLQKLPRQERLKLLAPLQALVDSEEQAPIRSLATEVLVSLEEEETWPRVRRALESDQAPLQASALRALGAQMRQRHAAELEPLLQTLRQSTPSPAVWREARIHLWLLRAARDFTDLDPSTQEAPIRGPPKWVRCPRMKKRDGGLEVVLGEETVWLRDLQAEKQRVEEGSCARVPDTLRADLLYPVDRACIVGHNHGEFGGRLALYESGSMLPLPWSSNPVRVVRPRGAIVVIDSTGHMGVLTGGLWRFERSGPGDWHAVFMALPGAVVSFGYTRSGELVLATVGMEDSPDSCSSTVFKGSIYRVTPEGQLVLEG